MANVVTVSSTVNINSRVDALRSMVIADGGGVICLDAEWDVFKNANGDIIGMGKVAVIQLGYRLNGSSLKALLLCRHAATPPDATVLQATTSLSFLTGQQPQSAA